MFSHKYHTGEYHTGILLQNNFFKKCQMIVNNIDRIIVNLSF